MALSLLEIKAIQEIAKHLYSFLPGQPHPFADKRISFAGIAYELGLQNFWQRGSKLPAITAFLENILEKKRDTFCSVILEIVRRGIKYRENRGEPITREDIKKLNELILKVHFKIPELWDKNFLNSLPSLSQQGISNDRQEEDKITQEKRKELSVELLKIGLCPKVT